jgi:hypothetical protein
MLELVAEKVDVSLYEFKNGLAAKVDRLCDDSWRWGIAARLKHQPINIGLVIQRRF